jgi:hypothetical protein
MFEVKAPETIPATLTIKGQGREQKLELVYHTKTRDEYQELVSKLQKGEASVSEVIIELVASWNANVGVDAAGIAEIQQEQPGLDLAILLAYGDAHSVGRKGN